MNWYKQNSRKKQLMMLLTNNHLSISLQYQCYQHHKKFSITTESLSFDPTKQKVATKIGITTLTYSSGYFVRTLWHPCAMEYTNTVRAIQANG